MSNEMTPRERAIASARERRSIGYTEEGACEHALRHEPTVKLSRDQLKALAFGATLYGFGQKVCPGCEEQRETGRRTAEGDHSPSCVHG